MMIKRIHAVSSSLILGAIGVAIAATAALSTFPGNLLVWQAVSWTLVVALLALLVLVPASAWSLATDRSARTWQRIASFSLGLFCLVVVAIGSI